MGLALSQAARKSSTVQSHISAILKRLVLFINEHNKKSEYLFWPDLASSHYAKNDITFLKA